MKHPVRSLHVLPALLVFSMALSNAAFAAGDRDRTQVGRNINIAPGEEVSDATCFGCTVRVRGHVSGDVTVFGGNVVLEDGGQIGGDVTTFGGSIRLIRAVTVRGDATVFGGRIERDPEATVGGDVTNMSGPGWILLIFVTPLILFGMFVALIIWVIRRMLRPAMPAAV